MDCGVFELALQCAYALIKPRDDEIRGELCERLQYEASQMHVRVGYLKVQLREDKILIQQEIDVDHSWSPVTGWCSTQYLFHALDMAEKRLRAEGGLYLDDRVDKVWLILGPHWWRAVEVGLSRDGEFPMLQLSDGFADGYFRLPEVGPESEVGKPMSIIARFH